MRLGIVGLGLIGGSLAAAGKEQLGAEVVAVDRREVLELPADMQVMLGNGSDELILLLLLGLDREAAAMLLIESDAGPGSAEAELDLAEDACRDAGSSSIERADARRRCTSSSPAGRLTGTSTLTVTGLP